MKNREKLYYRLQRSKKIKQRINKLMNLGEVDYYGTSFETVAGRLAKDMRAARKEKVNKKVKKVLDSCRAKEKDYREEMLCI